MKKHSIEKQNVLNVNSIDDITYLGSIQLLQERYPFRSKFSIWADNLMPVLSSYFGPQKLLGEDKRL